MRFFLLVILLCLGCDQATSQRTEQTEKKRFVSLSPAITETLFALGAGDQVVGITDFCRYPEALQTPEADKMRLGGMNPPIENIIAKKPDLVVGMHSDDQLLKNLDKLGVDSLRIKNTSYNDILATIKTLGESCDKTDAADKLITSIQDHYSTTKAPFQAKDKLHILLSISQLSDDPNRIAPWIVGEKSFYSEILRGMNTTAAAADGEDYYQASPEELIELNPQVIILLRPKAMSPEKWQSELATWQKLPHIEAVKNQQIYIMSGDYVMLPGPRITNIMDEFAQILHQAHNHYE